MHVYVRMYYMMYNVLYKSWGLKDFLADSTLLLRLNVVTAPPVDRLPRGNTIGSSPVMDNSIHKQIKLSQLVFDPDQSHTQHLALWMNTAIGATYRLALK